MEDRFLFRGKRIDNGEWVQGVPSYGEDGKIEEIEVWDGEDITFYSVFPGTICQCTGLNDKNGKLIWENDIVELFGYRGTIKYVCGGFGIGYRENIDWEEIQANIVRVTGCENILYACENDNYISLWEIYWNFNDEEDSVNTVEVIGNIFDNPELLESEG